jgi:peptidoglycan/xylan/chitin deacetylase (PgdA/CDA1 family)
MKFYRLDGRMELLPDDIWGGNSPTILLPEVSDCRPTGDVLFWAVDENGNRRALAWPDGLALDFDAAATAILDDRGLDSPRPWMSYSPFHPHCLPPMLRGCVRAVLATADRLAPRRAPEFPRWPIEPSLEVWKAIASAAGIDVPTPDWPNGKRFAVCLSHDVDTADGQTAVRELADIEEQLGLRSAWFLCPGNYELDHGLWSEMAARGHEIGCHGLLHDFKLPYLPESKIAERLNRALRLLEPYDVQGFRSPALLRTPALLEAVADRFHYDSSIPDTVHLHGANGSASIQPYLLGDRVEVPLTMPYDGELIALGVPLEQRLAVWSRKIEWIRSRGGLIHFLTHPDAQFSGKKPLQNLYRAALEQLVSNSGDGWFALPLQVAEHTIASRSNCCTRSEKVQPVSDSVCI